MPRKPAAPPQNVEAQESPELAQGTLLQTSEGADSDTSLSPDQPRWVVEDLDPPYTAPAPVVPVEGAAYGLGIRHLEEGLTYAFERWDEINVGDSYRIYMAGICLKQGEVTSANIGDSRVFLTIPNVPLGFVSDVYGEVERIGSGRLSTSAPQRVFIKNTRPGGADERPHEMWHSKLILMLSDTLIDSVVAARGITATIKHWEHMRVNDLVMFYWGAHRFDVPPITEDQVGQDLVFHIDREFLHFADSGHFSVQFFLYDEVRNRSGELQPWCKPVPVKVDLNLTLLDEPIIIEADEPTMVLDADALGRAPATAEVAVLRTGPFIVGDFIVLTVQGTTVDGEYVHLTMRQEVTRLNVYLEFPIHNEFVRSLIQSTISVSYVRERVGEDDLSSRTSTYTVAGVRFELPKPSVDQAHGPSIPADLPYITTRMPDYQPPGNAGDELKVEISAHYPDGSVERRSSSRVAGNHPRLRDFLHPDYSIFEGLRDTNIHYVVSDAAGSRESDRLWVQIGRPPRDLRAPIIQEAVNGNIDPAHLGSVGTLELQDEFRSGDIVIVEFIGSLTGRETVEYIVGVSSNPFIADIARRLFVENLDGTLTVSYLRQRFDVIQYSEEVVVTVGTALGELFLPEVLQATTGPDELDPALVWPDGATVRVRYEFIKTSDKVQMCWQGLPGLGSHFELVENQSGTFIDFRIPTTPIGFNIHPSGRTIQVFFKVIRNGFETSSPVLMLHLLPLVHPAGPLIDSIGDNAVLEVPLLQDFDETRVAPWIYANQGQRMWLRYDGIRNNGNTYVNEVYRGRDVDGTEVINGITSETPVLALRNLQDWSELTIRFWVTFDHSGDLANAVLFEVRHHMVQLVVNTYPHPRIKDSVPVDEPEVTIDPVVVENKCQVLVSYDNMNVGGTDRITLYWILASGVVIEVGTQDGLAGGTVTFNISNDVLAQSVNSVFSLQYTTELGRGGTGESDEQKVTVATIQPGQLPRALIDGVAQGGALRPSSMSGNASLGLAKWRLSRTGQRVWVTLSSSGVAPLEVLVAYPITSIEMANGLVNKPVLRSWLLSLQNNAAVVVSVFVTFDGSSDKSAAVVFPTTQYTIVHTAPLVFPETPVSLTGRTYLIPGSPNILPAFNAGNSITRTASGGTGGYVYSSSNTGVAVVTQGGFVSVRGNGWTTISVRDNSVPPQTRSYTVSVGGVVQCYGLGAGTYTDIINSASRQGVRVANIYELRDLSNAYGNRWPMGNFMYWSSTFSHSFLFFSYYYGRNINTGGEATIKQWVGSQGLGVGLR